MWLCHRLIASLCLVSERNALPRPSSPQAPALPGLLAALAAKLDGAEEPAMVQALLAVVAQLIHLDLTNTVTTLAALPMPGGKREGVEGGRPAAPVLPARGTHIRRPPTRAAVHAPQAAAALSKW